MVHSFGNNTEASALRRGEQVMLCSHDPRDKPGCRETIHYDVWVSGVPSCACHLPLHIDYPGRLTSLWVGWDNDLVT